MKHLQTNVSTHEEVMKKFLTLLLFFAAVGLLRAEGVALDHLTVEGRQSPLGLDVEVPRLGWQLRSEAQDVRQISYHVLVASSAELLARDSADVWDSGEVRSDQSQWVTCGARTLLPNRAYFWKVRVTTNRGRTGWSSPAQWSTGLMAQAN